MFNSPVSEVKGTKILVAQLTNGMQFTVFQNEVITETKTPNAMILPAPLSKSDLRFFDMTQHRYFFDDCEACFPKCEGSKSSWFSSVSESIESDIINEPFEDVVRIGSYKVRYEVVLEC